MTTRTASRVKDPVIDRAYLLRVLGELLDIPSPSGRTDAVVAYVCNELEALKIPYGLTRRGAIRAEIAGLRTAPARAIAAHVDTLGALVKLIKPSGRLQVVPVGHWSSRFAEGARCTLMTDVGRHIRGTILPLKASGHTYNKEIDSQPVDWDHIELRLDERVATAAETEALGVNVGDFIAIDTDPEIMENGFITSRHLDDKAGVASILAAAHAARDQGFVLPIACRLLFTVSEEVGVGASAILQGDISEMVSVDNGTIAPIQNTCEYGVTFCMQDMTGPFDYHLTRSLIGLARAHGIEHSRDVFRYYRSDAAAALEAGNDIRAALVCFALDASHGYERTHSDSLMALARLLALYMQAPPLFERDEQALGPIGDLPPAKPDSLAAAE